MCHSVSVKIPGKIIISGEHSVVHGCPALACATQLFITAKATSTTDQTITISSSDNIFYQSMTFQELGDLYLKNLRNLDKFRQGKLTADKILDEKTDILFHTAWEYMQTFNTKTGVSLVLDSKIPIGSGMGSSAAASSAVLASLCRLNVNSISKDKFISTITACENLIHGNSSGLDPATVILGGMVEFDQRKVVSRSHIENLSLYVVNTGRPLSTTGEAVAQVAPLFTNKLKESFTTTTRQIKNEILSDNKELLAEAVHSNQLLLEEIGVVPEKVSSFSNELWKNSIGFKICGAGAVRGENGGIGIIFAKEKQQNLIEGICRKYAYTTFSTTIYNGVPSCLK